MSAPAPGPRIGNDTFLRAIFGEQYIHAHVTGFAHDPADIPAGEHGRCWAGGFYKDATLSPGENQFFTVSLFAPEGGRANRRKANFAACYVVALDDVREKLPVDRVMRLPPPSIRLKSSRHSEQWLYLLSIPETGAARIDNLHDGLIANGLAPDGKDPGMKGVTRYVRLPDGCNTKAKRIQENGGMPPRCEVVEWRPERRYTLEQLAEPFAVNLDAPRRDSRVDGAASTPDHPLLHTPAIRVTRQRPDGRCEITCPWVSEHTGGDASGTAIFTNSDGSLGFKCHHGACEGRTGSDLLRVIEETDPGFGERLRKWQTARSFADVVPGEPPVNAAASSAMAKLSGMVTNERWQELEWQMSTDKFVLKDLAILGQWTVFYSGPNVGKTLLTLWLLREAVSAGEVDGSRVFYANCDDTYRGGVEKSKLADTAGFNMLLPGVRGFKPDILLTIMRDLVTEGDATGVVVVLDTLKKFTDLMDKREASKFGISAREFVSAGGSIICLAHVNKHRDAEGKSIHTGTADIRDDADCVYMIEPLSSQVALYSTTYAVQFENSKARGDVAVKAAFQFTKTPGAGYNAMFESVRRVAKDEAENMAQAEKDAAEQRKDAEAIEQIKAAFENGQMKRTGVVEFVKRTSDVPRNEARRVLDKYEGQIWKVKNGDNNSSIYSLNEPPAPVVDASVNFR